MVKKLPRDVYEKIYSTVPRLCVEGVVRYKSGTVLTKRAIPPSKGMWHLPGGTVLWGETLEEAVKRIVKEETGLDTIVKERAKIVKEYSKESGFGQAIGIIYILHVVGGSLVGDSNTADIKVFDEVPSNILKEHVEVLNDVGMK